MIEKEVLNETLKEHGLDYVLEIAIEWYRENRHHGITLEDLGTAIPDWQTLLTVVVRVCLDPDHPLYVEEGVQDFFRYLERSLDDVDA